MYSGEYDACDATLSVYPHRASLKNMPGHGGNRTYDLWKSVVFALFVLNVLTIFSDMQRTGYKVTQQTCCSFYLKGKSLLLFSNRTSGQS